MRPTPARASHARRPTVTLGIGDVLPRGLRVVALLALVACAGEAPPEEATYENILHFDTDTVQLVRATDTIALTVELARTPEQQRLGLMERRRLAERAGMLFVYDTLQPATAGFWMFRTRIPLDIAFLDDSGVVRAVRQMAPCTSTMPQGCPTYEPGVPYRYALEAGEGAFARLGLAIGSRVLVPLLPADSGAARTTP